ncbi:hypothetical protein RirG_012110 [Rhizophagus irregularis DAOM 197198w]|uniref:Uncharacterized protein n=1 Tax=Rhizophagus irregularis (strain DAOM 197198w) TaxID=1432141 RepID=A0A015LGI8_RHIIW|nr:hypothetical protein RirG_012110 [Rhizophagus irregularis DAOM 197198w]
MAPSLRRKGGKAAEAAAAASSMATPPMLLIERAEPATAEPHAQRPIGGGRSDQDQRSSELA